MKNINFWLIKLFDILNKKMANIFLAALAAAGLTLALSILRRFDAGSTTANGDARSIGVLENIFSYYILLSNLIKLIKLNQ
jgi:hypothetical protein